jgi:tRNA pseudouridine32 synthase/23S rRNA pseudouridine746 synthase
VVRLTANVTITSPDESPVALLHASTGLSKQRIKFAMTQGAVWLSRGRNTQRMRRAKRSLKAGDEIHLYYDTDILDELPAEPILVADVGGYSVWQKPYGLRSQGSKWGDHCTVSRWAERNLTPERSAFIVHRLDRAANGLILVAHSRSIAAALSKLFKERQVEKRYQVLVQGDFSQQANPLRVESSLDGKNSISEFSLCELKDGCSVLDVRIETGRKHQIRRHLAELGHPIVGDRLYGSGEEDGVDLQLCAYLLAFHCPVNDAAIEYRLPV